MPNLPQTVRRGRVFAPKVHQRDTKKLDCIFANCFRKKILCCTVLQFDETGIWGNHDHLFYCEFLFSIHSHTHCNATKPFFRFWGGTVLASSRHFSHNSILLLLRSIMFENRFPQFGERAHCNRGNQFLCSGCWVKPPIRIRTLSTSTIH